MATIKSIEEKAKAYDEALERAKHSDGIYPSAKELKEYIFPELRESEDERIKTFIRGLLLPHIADSHIEGDKIVHNKDIDNYRKALAWLERQGKQKPAEWSEKDEKHINSLLERLKGLCKNEFTRTAFAVSEDEDWLKSLGNRVLPQPKQEWSEEDEIHQLHAISLIEDIKDWANKDGMHSLCIERCIESIDWLKSIRPQSQWKPSDLQMEALMNQCINTKSTETGAFLCDLYCDLKKL